MVKLEEVTESHEDFSDGEPSDNDSNYTSDDSDSNEDMDESIIERLFALRDIIPVDTRESVANNISTIMSFGARSVRLLGNGAWILTTSALLIFMPLAYEIEREHAFDQAYSQMENEQLMGGSPTPYGHPGQQPIPPGPPGQHQSQPRGSLIPPGF